ncbi:MAG: efflux RND transporter periplasmic adaptor subunit [Lacunisphaera sp.]
MASSGKYLLKIIISLVVLAALGFGGYRYFQNRADDKQPEYTTITVTRGEITQVITATGELDAVLSVDVGSQISGQIVALHADFNTPVKKDQVLVEIDPATYQQKLRQAEATLASAKATYNLSELNAKRTQELFAKSLVTQQEQDQAQADLEQAKAQLLTNQASVENARVDLSRCTIYSPIDGVVISKLTEVGKTVAASQNVPVLFTIANDLSKMQITAAVAEADIGAVAEGQSVNFTADAFPNRTFHGTVTQVRNAFKVTSNVVTYDTIISVDNKDLKLRPGMTANVSIVVARRDNVLRVPNSALRVRMPEYLIAAKNPAPTKAAGSTKPSVASTPQAEASGSGNRSDRRGGGGHHGGMLSADATPEQRQKMRDIIAELGIDFRNGPPTAEQREQLKKRMAEEGLVAAPDASGGASPVSTRTVYRLPGGNKLAQPESVTVKVGITDGIASEILDGVAEGDVLITSVTVANPTKTAAPTSNPFGGGRRF